MQMYTDEALEDWGNLFVKHGLFEAGAQFVDFMARPDQEKRLWLRLAAQKNHPARAGVTSGRCDGARLTPAAGAGLTPSLWAGDPAS